MKPVVHDIILPVPPVALLQGYDTFTSEGLNTALKGSPVDAGASIDCTYTICEDVSSVHKALKISSSLSASFGYGSVDAKADFARSLDLTNTCVTVVVYAEKVQAQGVSNAVLDDRPPTDILSFYRSYGDSYVSRIERGSAYMVTYVFHTQSQAERNDVKAKLEAKLHGASGRVTADLDVELSDFVTTVSTRVVCHYKVLGFRNMTLPASDKLISFASDFCDMTADDPCIINYAVTGYEHVLPAGTVDAIWSSRDRYSERSAQYARLQAARNAVSTLETIYDAYAYEQDGALAERKQKILADIHVLEQHFDDMDKDPTRDYSQEPSLPSLAFGQPSLNVVLQVIDPSTAQGGLPFQDVTEGSVALARRPGQIRLQGDRFVTYMGVLYSSDLTASITCEHGRGGGPSDSFTFQRKEHVKEIRGTYIDLVHQLTITTSFGNTFTWPTSPDGAPSQNTFSFVATADTRFLGFKGRSGDYLDRLGIVTATFAPASWEVESTAAAQAAMAHETTV